MSTELVGVVPQGGDAQSTPPPEAAAGDEQAPVDRVDLDHDGDQPESPFVAPPAAIHPTMPGTPVDRVDLDRDEHRSEGPQTAPAAAPSPAEPAATPGAAGSGGDQQRPGAGASRSQPANGSYSNTLPLAGTSETLSDVQRRRRPETNDGGDSTASAADQFVLAADVAWRDQRDALHGLDALGFAGIFSRAAAPGQGRGAGDSPEATTRSPPPGTTDPAAATAAGDATRCPDVVDPTDPDETRWVSEACATEAVVPLERKNYHLTSHFAHPAAEAEYQRFVHRRGHLRDSAPFFAFATLSMNAVIFYHWDLDRRISLYVVNVVILGTAFTCLALEFFWRRAKAAIDKKAAADDNAMMHPGSSLPRPQVLLEARFARYRRVVVYVGAVLVSMLGSIIISLGAGSCGFVLSPNGTSHYDACVKSLHHIEALCLALIAVFVQGPIEVIGCLCFPLATTAVVEFAAVPHRYHSPGDTWVRLFMQATFSAFLVVLVVVRDRRAREHFEAIVVAQVAHRRTLQAHQQTAVAVAALLPSGLARRAARVPSGAGAASAGALTSLLSELREERAAASVAVTEAADMAAFQRRYPNPRLTVLGLCHLFTLFDVGTQVFGVERAGTFGDAYLVTAGLCESEHVATVADLARYALWQLGLDEIATLPLRSCIVTGRLRGAVVGSERLPRYTVSGPALAAAVGALKAVPAQQVWACEQTAGACGVRDASRLVAVDLGGDARGGSTGSQAPTADAVPQRFVVLTPEDLVADHAAPLVENVASQSMSIARDGRAGSHYSVQSDRLVRATLEERRHRRRRELLAQTNVAVDEDGSRSGDVVHGTTIATTSNVSPLDPAAVSGSAVGEAIQESRSVAAAAGADGVATRERSHDSGEWSDEAAVTMTGLGGWRFASDEVEDAFQREPRSLLHTALFFALLAVLVFASISVQTAARSEPMSGAFDVEAHMDANRIDPQAGVGVFVAVVTVNVFFIVLEACIRWCAIPHADRAFPLRSAFAVLLIVLGNLTYFIVGPSVARNDPLYTALLRIPVLAWSVFDRTPWWFAGAVITILVTVPIFGLFAIGIDSHKVGEGVSQLICACILSFAVVGNIVRRLRLQFAARYVARRRADAAQAATVQLSALVDALVPPHMLQEAMVAAGAMELRRRLLSVPGGAPAAYDAELVEIEDKLTDLARVLRGDHGDAPVDIYDEVVVAHVTLHSVDNYRGDDDRDCVLEAMWSTIEECLAEANEAYRKNDDDEGRVVRSVANQQAQLSSMPSLAEQSPRDTAGAPLATTAYGNDSEPAFSPLVAVEPCPTLGTVPVHSAPTVADAEIISHRSYQADDDAPARPTPPLLLVSHLRDSLVLVGPLDRVSDTGTVAAAGAAARFVGLLADRAAREAGVRVAVGLAAGEAAAALLGRGTMRYGVTGVAMQHAAALAAAAAGVSDAIAGASVVAATEHFAARYRASGEDALTGLQVVEHAWAIRGLGRTRPYVWRLEQ